MLAYEAEEVCGEFIVTGGDASPLFELCKEALAAPLFVGDAIIGMLMVAMTVRRNDRVPALIEDDVVQGVGIVSAVASTCLAGSPRTRLQAGAISVCWRGPRRKRTGNPSASTTAWILRPNPPRERPRAWACGPPAACACADHRGVDGQPPHVRIASNWFENSVEHPPCSI